MYNGQIYVQQHPLTKGYLLVFQDTKLVAVLHRTMVDRGVIVVSQIMLKWRNLPPKHGTWKFAANIDPVMAILHRKMINWGSVSALKVLINWEALPLKHGTCDYSSLRTRMFEGEGIFTGMKY